MREHFLFFVWQHQLYNRQSLRTSDGEELLIINPGVLNNNAGPDFLEAHISISGLQWKGSIEIHVDAKDWLIHKHHINPAFNNVILHVVFHNNAVAQTTKARAIPCLELKTRIDAGLLDRYRVLNNNLDWVPCAQSIKHVRHLTINMAIERSAHTRIYQKAHRLLSRLAQTDNDWHQLAFESLARSFGFNINGDAFELIARQTPISIIQRNVNDRSLIESLFIGQANLMDRLPPEDAIKLTQDYSFLQNKYGLKPINPGICKYLRTRPANFPHLRLIQLAALFHKVPQLTGIILSVDLWKDWQRIITIRKSPLWSKLGSGSSPHSKSSSILLFINTVLPLQLAYAIKKGDHTKEENVLNKFNLVPPEKNSIINKWKALGLAVDSACQTQGLLHLYNNQCKQKKCSVCPVGMEILTSSRSNSVLE